jgi:transposase
MKYIGLDIHKKDTQACVLDEKGKVILIKRVRTDVSDIGHLFGMIEADEKNLSVVMEATGFYFWIHDLIVARSHDVVVVHPTKAKDMMKSMSKTDKNDAFMLADLLFQNRLKGIYVPSLDIREMRDLTRHRESLVRKKGDAKRGIQLLSEEEGQDRRKEGHRGLKPQAAGGVVLHDHQERGISRSLTRDHQNFLHQRVP